MGSTKVLSSLTNDIIPTIKRIPILQKFCDMQKSRKVGAAVFVRSTDGTLVRRAILRKVADRNIIILTSKCPLIHFVPITRPKINCTDKIKSSLGTGEVHLEIDHVMTHNNQYKIHHHQYS